MQPALLLQAELIPSRIPILISGQALLPHSAEHLGGSQHFVPPAGPKKGQRPADEANLQPQAQVEALILAPQQIRQTFNRFRIGQRQAEAGHD